MAMSNDVWAEAVTTEPSTYDLTAADYAFRPINGGQHGHIDCWNGLNPRPGDYLILRNGEQTTRYQVTDVNPCLGVDPPTMWMAGLEFAPRPGRFVSETGPGATDSQ